MKLSDLDKPSDNGTQTKKLRDLVEKELNRAEKIWDGVGDKMLVKAYTDSMTESLLTAIPGHPEIDPNKPAVDVFIVLVVDMRQSSVHLNQAIGPPAKVSMTERMFYETSALLPAAAESIRLHGGKVTEYLGDGVLALFRASEDRDQACYKACRSARLVVGDMRDIVNDALANRYILPPIDLGVGMAFSPAVVTAVGHPDERAPKAIGVCVYRASKLASGYNEIMVDDNLKAIWPKDKSGHGFKFGQRTVGKLQGNIIPPK